MGKHILIVEDDELVADHLAALVRDQLDGRPVVASSTGEAMALSAERLAFGFLDIKVSDGLTFSLATHLRARGVPFVFVSASDPAKVPVDLSDTLFLRKPVPPTRLLAVARAHL